jgi:lysophospholipase L1-like esterase
MTPSKIGVNMATAADIAARTAADIAAMTYSPSEILINLGANDINGALLSANWQTNMTAIINAYHTAFPVANLRLAKVWKRGGSAGGTQASHAIIDALYSANPWLKPGIDEAFLEGGDDGATYTTDGTHPNAAGQVLEANAWKSAIGG